MPTVRAPNASPWPSRVADVAVAASFLGLVFLLGVFRLKDTDFWWHLRAGDEIRRTFEVPHVDTYAFGSTGRPWIDLHWLFQVLLSWGYEHGGVPALTLAKCAITTASVALLLFARRRDWPLWSMCLAWLPALYVLSGRMYVRPETLTLLYLSIDLAILTRIRERPRLAYVLPAVQALWANSQGLFVLGPILIGMALVDRASRPGAFDRANRPWWRTTLTASALTAAACVLNPYGLLGALYPAALVQTMGDPIFRSSIAELQPIAKFIAETGLGNPQLRVHFAAMALGLLSFLVPMIWSAANWRRAEPGEPVRRKKAAKAEAVAPSWRPSPFRLMLFVAFSALSLQATRNSHQYAAVVGALTAWNLGEWAAVVASRRAEGRTVSPLAPRLLTLGVLLGSIVAVASGVVFDAAGEGRRLGLGEEPLWFPKEAIRFAGREGMPDKMVCFHNGHAALYEYMNGPDKKPYLDARLEVIGPDLYKKYIALQRSIVDDAPGWSESLSTMGKPGLLIDNVHPAFAPMAANVAADGRWRWVWFDPIASIFVPRGEASGFPDVDFGSRHFWPEPASSPVGVEARLASATALRRIGASMQLGRRGRPGPLLMLGLGHARRALAAASRRVEGPAYRELGLILALADPPSSTTSPRYGAPFDPVFDLGIVRSTYALIQSLTRGDPEFLPLLYLSTAYEQRQMDEADLPILEALAARTRETSNQGAMIAEAARKAGKLRRKLGERPDPSPRWENADALDRLVRARLDAGRAESAAILLESAEKPEARSWETADRIGTLWLHLGQPGRARAAWETHREARPAQAGSRIAATYLVEDDFTAARASYKEALAAEPNRFEALLGLATLERDDGRAPEALDAARRAVEAAPTEVARTAARGILSVVEPYAEGPRRTDP